MFFPDLLSFFFSPSEASFPHAGLRCPLFSPASAPSSAVCPPHSFSLRDQVFQTWLPPPPFFPGSFFVASPALWVRELFPPSLSTFLEDVG